MDSNQALLNNLVAQRNWAMDELARACAKLDVAEARLAELESKSRKAKPKAGADV